MNTIHRSCSFVALLAAAALALPHAASAQATPNDSASVAQVIHRFHEALARGDSSAAMALLAPDVVIMEGGGVERYAEYRSHHLSGDIAFARAVPSTREPIRVIVSGDAAWAWSTGVTQGSYKDRAINTANAELMVVSRVNGAWLIRSVHWSSRARK